MIVNPKGPSCLVPEEPNKVSKRITHGGSWAFYAGYLTVSYRGSIAPGPRGNRGLGFRIVRNVRKV